MKKEPYRGPVLYITHSAPLIKGSKGKHRKLLMANRAKIRYSLELAAYLGIPIVYEKNLLSVNREAFGRILSSLAKKPRVVRIDFFSKVRIDLFSKSMSVAKEKMRGVHIEELKRVFARENITPTTILFEGHRRDVCVKNSIEVARAAFPEAKLIVVKGAYSVLEPNAAKKKKTKRRVQKEEKTKRSPDKEFDAMGVKQIRSLSRKRIRKMM